MNSNSKDLYVLTFTFINSNDYSSKTTAFLIKCTKEEAAKTWTAHVAKELGMTVREYITDNFSDAWDDPAADHCRRCANNKEIDKFIFENKIEYDFLNELHGFEKFDCDKWKKYNITIPLNIYNENIQFKYD